MDAEQQQLSRKSLIAAIAVGAIMGTVLAAGNVYAGLKIGFTTDGSLVAAVLAVVMISAIGRLVPASFTPRHTNLTQTAASSGAFCAVAGLTNAVPAMRLGEVTVSPWLLIPWVFFVAALGICIAVPLRRRAIEVDKLRFPSGVVCAQTIRTLHAKAASAAHGARTLGAAAGFSAVVTWLREAGLPGLTGLLIPMKTTIPGALGAFSCANLSIGVAWSPLLFAVGGIVGLRTALSFFLGGALAWVVGGPLLATHGLIDPEANRAIVSWTVWPAVGIITAGGLTGLLLGAGIFKRALGFFRKSSADEAGAAGKPLPGAVPRSWWIGGLVLAAGGTAATAWIAFRVPVWQSLLAIVLALPIAAVAIRAVGETDFTPANNLAKATQFIFAGIAPGQTVTNIAAAGVAAGCAQQASEVMTDLKSGAILNNRPRDQFIAQIVGILVASGAAVAAYSLLVSSISLGGEAFPAPSAVAWRTLADGLAGGKSAIPQGAVTAAWIAAAAGAALGIMTTFWKRLPLPSPVAVGLGAIFSFSFSISILLGAIAAALASKYARRMWERDGNLIMSGLIVGESLTGLLASGLLLAGWL